MANSPLENIYNRIKEAGGYHPMTANTFADWSLEAGDVVNVSRDGQTYNVPVHTSKLKWNGKQEVEIETTGKRERDSIAKESQRKYGGRGASGLRNGQGMYDEAYDMYGNVSRLWNTAQGLYHEVYDSDGNFARLDATAKGLYHEVYDSEGKVGRLQLTADGLKHEVEDSDGRVSRITNTIDGFKAYLHGETDEYGHLTEASIATALDDEGKAGARIDGAWIQIGSKGTADVVIDGMQTTINSQETTINGILHAGYITAKDITTTLLKDKIGEIDLLNVNAIAAASGGAYCYLSEFKGNNYKVNIEGGAGSVSTRDLCDGVYDIGLSYNSGTGVYTLQKKTIKESNWTNVGTFSRAVSLSGEWDGGTYSVSAKSGTISGTAPRETLSAASGITASKPPTIDANYPKTAIVPIKVYSYANGSTERKDTGYSGNAQCDMSALLEAGNFTENGNFPHSTGKLGYNTVTVNVDKSVKLTGRWNNGTYSVSAKSGTISGTAPRETLSAASGITASKPPTIDANYPKTAIVPIKVYSYANGSTERKDTGYSGNAQCDMSALLEAGNFTENGNFPHSTGKLGYNTVTVNVDKSVKLTGRWNNGLFSVSAASGTISGTAPSATAFVSNDTSRSVIKTAGTTTGISIPYNVKSVVNGTGDPVIVSSGMLSGNVADLLQDKTVTSNQTVTPGDGYIGLKSVTVNVSTTKPSLSGAWSSGEYKVTASPSGSISGTAPSTKIDSVTSGAPTKENGMLKVPVSVTCTINGTGTQVATGYNGNTYVGVSSLLQERTGVIPKGQEVVVTPGSAYIGLSRVTIAAFVPNLKGTWSGTAAEKTYTVRETITDTAFATKFKATADGSGGTSFKIHVTGKAENEETYSDKTTTTLYLKANGATVSVYDNSSGTGTAYASMSINTSLSGTWPSGAATLAERTYTVKETKSGATLNTVFTAVPATGPSSNKSQFYIRVASKGENDDAFVVKSRTNMYLSATGLTVTVHDNDSGSGTAYATILAKPLASDIGVGSEGWYGEGGTLPSATTLSNLGSIINNNHRGYAYFTVSAGKTNKRYRIPIN